MIRIPPGIPAHNSTTENKEVEDLEAMLPELQNVFKNAEGASAPQRGSAALPFLNISSQWHFDLNVP